jgi:hypothetical protein
VYGRILPCIHYFPQRTMLMVLQFTTTKFTDQLVLELRLDEKIDDCSSDLIRKIGSRFSIGGLEGITTNNKICSNVLAKSGSHTL